MSRRSLRIVLPFILIAILLMVIPTAGEDTFTITAIAGIGGKITPSGSVTVAKQSSQSFTIEASPGYRIDNVLVDHKSVGAISEYTFNKINMNHAISAYFTPSYGSLQVQTEPPGASVFIDNTFYGATNPYGPVTFTSIIPGTHSVRIILAGYQEYQSDVQIVDGQTTDMELIVLPPVPTTTVTTTATTTQPTTSSTTTIPTTTVTTTATTSAVPQSPPPTTPPITGAGNIPLSPASIPGVFVVLVIGGLATIILSRDVLGTARERGVSMRRRLLGCAVFAIPCAAIGVVLHWFLEYSPSGSWGFFPELASVIVPLLLYLILSSIALMMGTLLSWPFRGTMKAHTVAGVLVIFLSLLTFIAGEPSNRFVAGVMLLSGVLTTLAARWQDGTYGSRPEGESVPPAGSVVPGGGPDETKVVSTTARGMFPQELTDKYTVLEFVGSGGLARVFKARNLETGGVVALKIPLQSDENTGKAFMKEIMGWEGLEHENIVKVSGVNILPVPYVEMEFINRTLSDLGKPLSVSLAARICRDVARGLQFAHERGIIHRDIKPQNILVTSEGIPKISDWGMSKVMGMAKMPTITGFSLAYAAPEQLAPQTFGETDQRTDIYQLGCVLYELVTGTVPFPGSDMIQVSAHITSGMPALPSSLNSDARPLDAIIMRCLAKKPGDRYQEVRDLIRDLDEYLLLTEKKDRYNIFED